MPCTQVTVEPQDESTLNISSPSINQTSRNSFEVSAEITNQPTSGSGTRISSGVLLTVDGSSEAEDVVEPQAGQSQTVSFTVSGLSPGQHNICVELA
jgi:hypothetical protein